MIRSGIGFVSALRWLTHSQGVEGLLVSGQWLSFIGYIRWVTKLLRVAQIFFVHNFLNENFIFFFEILAGALAKN